MLAGDNSILEKGEKADEETNKQTATEIINLKITNAQIETYSKTQAMPTLQYLADRFYEDDEIEYVYNQSQKTASIEKEKIKVTGEYIYTKLVEYPYEFKINSSLQLAKVDDENVIKPTTVTKDELLIDEEPLVVDTTTTWQYINIDFPIKSISEYSYVLLKYGNYNSTTRTVGCWNTTLLPVDEVSYSQSEYITLNAAAGLNWTAATMYFIDDHTIRFYDAAASNNGRTKFAITSIKGIK